MKIQKFEGGLNTRIRPHMINLNEAERFNNIDNASGILFPIRDKTESRLNVSRYNIIYNALREWISTDEFRSYVEFEKKLYWTNGTGRPQKFDSNGQFNLGITAPTSAPTLTAGSTVDAVETIDSVPGYTGTLTNTEHQYIIVNDNGTYYSNALKININLARPEPEFDWYLEEDFWEDYRREPYADRDRDIYNNFYYNYNTLANRNIVFSGVEGITFGSNGVKVFRLYAGKYYLVGSLADSLATLDDNVLDISANAELDGAAIAPINGTYSYVYTFYNSTTGVESAPSPASDELFVNEQITVSGLDISADPQVTHKRIYRVGGNLTVYSLVAEVDAADVSYVDLTQDTQIIGTVLTSSDNQPPPDGLDFLCEAYAIFFGAVGNKLRFSDIGNPDYWPSAYFITFSDDITGIAPVANGVIIFTTYKSYILTGTTPQSFAQTILSADQGCIGFRSLQVTSDSAMWVSTDGVCVSNGSVVKVLTRDKLGKLELRPIDSAVHDEVYYVLEDDRSVFCVDFRHGNIIFKTIEVQVDALTVAEDNLYGHYGGILYKLFNSDQALSFEYKSPKFIEGRSTEEKTYKKVYIYSSGDIMVNIYIDDQLVATKELNTTNGHQIQVPQNLQRGHFIQFEISGTGECWEIEYVVGNRQND